MEINEKPSFYAVLPAYVRYEKRLKPAERLLFAEISALTNKFGYCTASNGYFAELYGIEKETVSRWVNHLAKLGFLRLEMVYEGKQIKGRKIWIDEKVMTPIDEKVKGNNTRLNNTRLNNTPLPPNAENKKRFEAVAKLFNQVFEDCPMVARVGLEKVPNPKTGKGEYTKANQKRMKLIPYAWQIAKMRIDRWKDSDGLIDGEEPNGKHVLEWFKTYFEECKQDRFINGTSARAEAHKNWKADFDYMLKAETLEKRVLEK